MLNISVRSEPQTFLLVQWQTTAPFWQCCPDNYPDQDLSLLRQQGASKMVINMVKLNNSTKLYAKNQRQTCETKTP